jgi:hypothetical protein
VVSSSPSVSMAATTAAVVLGVSVVRVMRMCAWRGVVDADGQA